MRKLRASLRRERRLGTGGRHRRPRIQFQGSPTHGVGVAVSYSGQLGGDARGLLNFFCSGKALWQVLRESSARRRARAPMNAKQQPRQRPSAANSWHLLAVASQRAKRSTFRCLKGEQAVGALLGQLPRGSASVLGQRRAIPDSLRIGGENKGVKHSARTIPTRRRCSRRVCKFSSHDLHISCQSHRCGCV